MPEKAKQTKQGPRSEESAYLRRTKPVNVRRGPAAWARMMGRWCAWGLIAVGLVFAAQHAIGRYVEASPSFRFSADEQSIRVTGLRFVEESEIRRIFESDHGRSMTAIPMELHRFKLLAMAWIKQARVLRVWPNQLWVHVEERQPVAWVRTVAAEDFSRPRLVDPNGVFLDPPTDFDIELPVVSGLDDGMSTAERRVRIALVQDLMKELGDEHSKVSEIDVADSSNARVLILYDGDVVELKMGAARFRHRWDFFHKYVRSWKKKYGRIGSVDLRFQGQVAVRRVDS